VRLSKRQLAQRRRRQKEENAARNNPLSDNDLSQSLLPVGRRQYSEPINVVSFGRMNVQCTLCKALHWLDERLKESLQSVPCFSRCCHHGKVVLPRLPDPPDRLKQLFTDRTSEGREFRGNIRRYNSALAFTSFKANEKDLNVLRPSSYLGVVRSLVLIFCLICTYRTVYPHYRTILDLAAI
jgi:hypothetical protein